MAKKSTSAPAAPKPAAAPEKKVQKPQLKVKKSQTYDAILAAIKNAVK